MRPLYIRSSISSGFYALLNTVTSWVDYKYLNTNEQIFLVIFLPLFLVPGLLNRNAFTKSVNGTGNETALPIKALEWMNMIQCTRNRNITVGFVVAINLIAQSYLCSGHKQYQLLSVNVHNSRLIYRMLTTSIVST